MTALLSCIYALSVFSPSYHAYGKNHFKNILTVLFLYFKINVYFNMETNDLLLQHTRIARTLVINFCFTYIVIRIK